MIIQIKKKEGEINGRISIINRRGVKMNFPENKNKSDNDIFKTSERISKLKPDKKSLDKRIDEKIKENSLYINGKKNANFKIPHLNSQIVIGEPLNYPNSTSIREIPCVHKSSSVKESITLHETTKLGKSRNQINNLYKTNINNSNNRSFVEIFGSVNKSFNNEKNNETIKCQTPTRKLDFTNYTINNSQKVNFFESSYDNPLRTMRIDQTRKSFQEMSIQANESTDIHNKIQSLKHNLINEKINEREKSTEFISKSFFIDKEKLKEKNERLQNGNGSFFETNLESKITKVTEANNIAHMTVKDTDLSFGENKNNINELKNNNQIKPKTKVDKYNSVDSTRINEYRELIYRKIEEKKKEKDTILEKNETKNEVKKEVKNETKKTIENKLNFKKDKTTSSTNRKQGKEEFNKTDYYTNEIKKLKEKEKILMNLIMENPKFATKLENVKKLDKSAKITIKKNIK